MEKLYLKVKGVLLPLESEREKKSGNVRKRRFECCFAARSECTFAGERTKKLKDEIDRKLSTKSPLHETAAKEKSKQK